VQSLAFRVVSAEGSSVLLVSARKWSDPHMMSVELRWVEMVLYTIFGDVSLPAVDSATDLGVSYDNNLKFGPHQPYSI